MLRKQRERRGLYTFQEYWRTRKQLVCHRRRSNCLYNVEHRSLGWTGLINDHIPQATNHKNPEREKYQNEKMRIKLR